MDLTDYKDTTGTLLRVVRTFREKDANAASDHITPPQSLPAVLQAPLSQFMDRASIGCAKESVLLPAIWLKRRVG